MNSALVELLNKIPVTLILVAYLGYLGLEFYTFTTDPSSILQAKKRELQNVDQNNKKLEAKIEELNEFVASLERKKVEVRNLAGELQELKATLSERLDVPAFMKMVITEAKKVGLGIGGLTPLNATLKKYYIEQSFQMKFKGLYPQLLSFLDRLKNVSELVKVRDFEIKPHGEQAGKFIEIEGQLELITFYYRGTKEDDVANTGSGDQASQGG